MPRFTHPQHPRPILGSLALYPHLAARLIADPVLPDTRLGSELMCIFGMPVADTSELYARAVLGCGID